jgi:cytoskeletal protein RodZ
MDISITLREARERQGMTLDGIARATNIPARVLQAIEGGRLDEVPGGLFIRSYLRAYAAQVGLDPDGLVTAYLAQLEAAPDEDLDALRVRCASRGARSRVSKIWLVAAVLALIACGAFLSATSRGGGDRIVEAADRTP